MWYNPYIQCVVSTRGRGYDNRWELDASKKRHWKLLCKKKNYKFVFFTYTQTTTVIWRSISNKSFLLFLGVILFCIFFYNLETDNFYFISSAMYDMLLLSWLHTRWMAVKEKTLYLIFGKTKLYQYMCIICIYLYTSNEKFRDNRRQDMRL